MTRSPKSISQARLSAWQVLIAMENNDLRLEQALALQTDLSELDPRDRALALELVYGVTRWRLFLDRVIEVNSSRKPSKIAPDALNLLRIGAYQMIKLDRIPDRAAVHTSVELARAKLPGWATGFVNGVLRSIGRTGSEVYMPDRAKNLVGFLSVSQSHPPWLVKLWLERFGDHECEQLLAANNIPTGLTVRVNGLRYNRDEFLSIMSGHGLEAEPGEYAAGAVVVKGQSVAHLEKLVPAGFTAQSQASQLVGLLTAPQPGSKVLDLCAGVGGKTGHLAEMMGDHGRLIALDKDQARVEAGQAMVKRLGLKSVEYHVADGTKPLPNGLQDELFDTVLVDAPCTGLGTFRSRPDRRWRVKPKDPLRLGKLQLTLLESAAERVKPEGTLVFATCTIDGRENEDVVQGFLARQDDFELDDPIPYLPGPAIQLARADGFVVTLPHKHNIDGFFMARLKRNRR